MAISFPSTPATNDVYTYNNKSWTYNGSVWIQNTTTIFTLDDNVVTTSKIADGAVTAVKLAAGAAVPSQTGNSGKYLTTDGEVATWGTVNSLPPQDTNSGKYLTTDGNTASWGTVTTTPADGSITPVKLALGTTYLPMAIGTTAERPSTPASGYTRINTTTNYFEVYYNSQWINLQYIGAMTITYTGTPTVTTSGGFTTLQFTSSGSITVTNMQSGSTFEYLMVAGGGGGGNTMGGGGGAGGLLYNSGFSPATSNQYSFTIGAGGAGATNRSTVGGSGTNTTGFTLTCVGGGGGAGWESANGAAGGSSGGGPNARTAGTGTAG